MSPVLHRKKKIKSLTIKLIPGTGPAPAGPSLKKRGPHGPGDRVRWANKDGRGHTITFTLWPFVEAPLSISIAAGATSEWFHVYPQTTTRNYDYAVDPRLETGPPGEPSISVDD